MSKNKQYENGVVVVQIDRNVSAVAAAFGFLQDLHSRFFKSKPCTPAAHVVAASATECEQLVPMLFHKEQDPLMTSSCSVWLSPKALRLT